MRVPEDAYIEVVLAKSADAAAKAISARPLIVVAADADKWNDFSKNFHTDLHIILEGERFELRGLLVFPNQNRSRGKIDELLAGEPTHPFEAISEVFCTLLHNDGTYRLFVELLGLARAAAALRKMHDVVLARAEGAEEAFLELTQTKDFHEGALRQEKTWAGLRRGARHLRMEPLTEVQDASRPFKLDVDLPGLPGPYTVDLTFGDHPLREGRMFVLAGKNGTGKTRLLRAIIDGVRSNAPWAELRGDGPEAKFTPPPRFSKLVVISSVATDQYPRSIPPWAGLDYRYYSMIGRRDDQEDELTMALIDCLREDYEDETFDEEGRMKLLREMIEPLDIHDNIYVRLRDGDSYTDLRDRLFELGASNYAKLFAKGGEQQKLRLYSWIDPGASPEIIVDGKHRQLSSGELALLRFAAQATAAAERGTLFLFDEPETHLHPNFISRFMAMLGRLLDDTGSAAIIATHSAYIVREVPSRSVRVLSIDDDGAHATEPRMQTFGANIDTISQFVFGDTLPDHLYLKTLRAWIARQPEGLTVTKMIEELSDELNSETLSYLAQLIRDRSPE